MGRDSTFYCKTCKTSYYLGYGSHGTWLDGCQTLDEYKQTLREVSVHKKHVGRLRKNDNMRRCLQQHAGHNFETHSNDWARRRNGKLFGQFGPMGSDVELFDITDWEYINLAPD